MQSTNSTTHFNGKIIVLPKIVGLWQEDKKDYSLVFIQFDGGGIMKEKIYKKNYSPKTEAECRIHDLTCELNNYYSQLRP